MTFDLVVVLFLGMCALLLSGVVAGAWWFNGMQLALWLRGVLGISGALLLIGLFYLLLRLLFTKIVIADTDADIFTALSVSWSATQGFFWRIVVMVIVVGVMSALVSGFATHIARFMTFVFDGRVPGFLLGTLLGKVVEVFAALINIVFIPIVTLYYYLQFKVVRTLVAGR
jgi:membrane-anchored glycerophosphoryl diester phosphodiesterase (GDPDase)